MPTIVGVWPVGPLLRKAGLDLEQIDRPGRAGAALGVGEKVARRWQERGLTTIEADVAAVHLGFHPAEVWPAWYQTEADVA